MIMRLRMRIRRPMAMMKARGIDDGNKNSNNSIDKEGEDENNDEGSV